MKIKKKVLVSCSCFLVVLSLILIVSNTKKDYDISYQIDDYEIREIYDDEDGFYKFSLKRDEKKYDVVIKSKYIKKRRLVTSVESFDSDSESCVLMKSKKVDIYPVCISDGEYVDYDLLENYDEEFYKRENIDGEPFEYDGIEFTGNSQKKFLIWDHKGYLYIDGADVKELHFLEKESYYNHLAYEVSNYVITPQYDEKYTFTKINIVNMSNGNLTEWNLNEEISYNSYFLGEKDGLIYIVDKKSKREYSLDPKKQKIVRIDKDDVGRVWRLGWEDVSMTKLINNDYSFEESKIYQYMIDDSKLSLKTDGADYSTRVSDHKIDKVVKIQDDEVFYLVGDSLYSYSLRFGEKLVIKYSEFNFNNVNSVFIY